MGQYECDDGNLKDGDGCSSECKLEKDFDCQKLSNSQTVCTKSSNPSASLSLQNNNLLLVTFNEPMKVKMDSSIFSSTIKLSLNLNCELTWKLNDIFEEDAILTQLKISISPECTIKRKNIVFTLEFTNSFVLLSLKGYALTTNTLKTGSKKITYASASLSKSTEVIGAIFETFSIITLLIMIASILFQSVAVESFWSFINMIQVLSYLPILDLELPYNLEVFLTEYLSMGELVLPFDLIPDLPFNPADLAEFFLAEAFNEKFALNDFGSFNFLYVYYEELFTWIVMGFIYLLLKVLCYIVKYAFTFILALTFSKSGRKNINIIV